MQFGFMEDFRNPEPWARPFPELYNALLDQTIRAEELGYEHVWLTEHHFTADGYNPSLLPTAAAIATRTEHYSDWDVYSAAAVSASDSGGGRCNLCRYLVKRPVRPGCRAGLFVYGI